MTSGSISRQGVTLHNRLDNTLIEGINLRLAMTGCPTFGNGSMSRFPKLAAPMFSRQKETMRLLADYLCPADWRIDHFLREYLYDTGVAVRWPARTFVLDSPGLARELSLPPDRDEFFSAICPLLSHPPGRLAQSRQRPSHHPRRLSRHRRWFAGAGRQIGRAQGSFRPSPGRRLASPPSNLLRLPFTSTQDAQAECFVSLLLPPGRLSWRPRIHRREIHGNSASSRPAASSATSDFIETIFWQRRRSLPPRERRRGSMSNIGPVTPVASSSPRT